MQCWSGPINLRFLFEGEEEIGSPNLGAIILEHRPNLVADAVVSDDGGPFRPDRPCVTVSLKSLGGCQVNIRTVRIDLHSGAFGAAASNAVQSLIQLPVTFHDSEGRVAIDGFFDQVVDLTPGERAGIAALEEDDAAILASLGLDAFWGEPGWTSRECRAEVRRWTSTGSAVVFKAMASRPSPRIRRISRSPAVRAEPGTRGRH